MTGYSLFAVLDFSPDLADGEGAEIIRVG